MVAEEGSCIRAEYGTSIAGLYLDVIVNEISNNARLGATTPFSPD